MDHGLARFGTDAGTDDCAESVRAGDQGQRRAVRSLAVGGPLDQGNTAGEGRWGPVMGGRFALYWGQKVGSSNLPSPTEKVPVRGHTPRTGTFGVFGWVAPQREDLRAHGWAPQPLPAEQDRQHLVVIATVWRRLLDRFRSATSRPVLGVIGRRWREVRPHGQPQRRQANDSSSVRVTTRVDVTNSALPLRNTAYHPCETSQVRPCKPRCAPP